MKQIIRLVVFLWALAALASAARAQSATTLVNYQGKLTASAVSFSGKAQFKFALVDSAGTTTYWSNDGTSSGGSEPSASVTLVVVGGWYAVQLGDTTLSNMTAVPDSLFTDHGDVRLRVWFDDGVNGSQLLSPDQNVTAAGYVAATADLQQAQADLDARTKDLADATAKLADSTKQIEADKAQIGDLNTKLTDTTTKLTDTTTKLTDTSTKLDAALKDAQAAKDQAAKDAAAFAAKLADDQKNYEALKADTDAKISALSKSLDDSKASIVQLTTDLDTSKTLLAAKIDELAKKQTELDQANGDKTQLQQQLTSLTTERDSLKKRTADLETQLQTEVDKMKAITGDLQQMQADLDAQTKALAATQTLLSGQGLPAAFSSWQAANFTPQQLADAAISGPAADPDGDGVCNLLEYAFGMPPLQTSRYGLPVVTQPAGSSYLAISFTRAKSATELLYVVEGSSDLKTWTTVTSSPVIIDRGTTETVTVSDTVVAGSVAQRYLRVRVIAP